MHFREYHLDPLSSEPFYQLHHPIATTTITLVRVDPPPEESDKMEPSYKSRTIGSDLLTSKCADLIEMREDNNPEDAAEIALLLSEVRKEWTKCLNKVFRQFLESLRCRLCCIEPMPLHVVLQFEREYSLRFSATLNAMRGVVKHPEKMIDGIGPDDQVWEMLHGIKVEWWQHHLADRHRAPNLANHNGIPQHHLIPSTPVVLWRHQSFIFPPAPDVVKMKRDWLAKIQSLYPNFLKPRTGPQTKPAASKQNTLGMKEGQLPTEGCSQPEKQDSVASLVHHSPELTDRSHPSQASKASYPTLHSPVFSQDASDSEEPTEPSGPIPVVPPPQSNEDHPSSKGATDLRTKSIQAPGSQSEAAPNTQSTAVIRDEAPLASQEAAESLSSYSPYRTYALLENPYRRPGGPSGLLPNPYARLSRQFEQVSTNRLISMSIGPNLELPSASDEKEQDQSGSPSKHTPGIATQPKEPERTSVKTTTTNNRNVAIESPSLALSTKNTATAPTQAKTQAPVAHKSQRLDPQKEITSPGAAISNSARRQEISSNKSFGTSMAKSSGQPPENIGEKLKDNQSASNESGIGQTAINQAEGNRPATRASTNKAANNQAATDLGGISRSATDSAGIEQPASKGSVTKRRLNPAALDRDSMIKAVFKDRIEPPLPPSSISDMGEAEDTDGPLKKKQREEVIKPFEPEKYGISFTPMSKADRARFAYLIDPPKKPAPPEVRSDPPKNRAAKEGSMGGSVGGLKQSVEGGDSATGPDEGMHTFVKLEEAEERRDPTIGLAAGDVSKDVVEGGKVKVESDDQGSSTNVTSTEHRNKIEDFDAPFGKK
ncbi:hypothetical protein HYALB_00008239 [Hymenoscyphus albidus]|uniref:Uncharacterized protein n=1 Tax=Hymenoscyphus albidus TaxID=595503 RepID=A0A9N9LL84_9HELO|nr:hypothetical protein HYALB_00008239 [Hymenoscyphus albidus]